MAPYDFYDYEAYWQNRQLEDCCERNALALFFKQIPNHHSLLDIGGGYGRLTESYAPLYKNCLIVDPSQSLLSLGKKKNQFKNVTFRRGSLPNLDLEGQTFETILLIRVSHHLPDLVPSLKTIHQLLTKDGFLILEIANKIHFLARLRAWLSGNFAYTRDFSPVERRSQKCIEENQIPFSNHHPQKVLSDLTSLGFTIKSILSVSNCRSPFLKKLLPENWLVSLEKRLQKPFGQLFFGPSIFILAQK